MQNCPACGYEQQQGNFCGGCGTSFLTNTAESATSLPTETSTRYQPKRRSSSHNRNSQPNRLQIELRDYTAYFKATLINPTDTLTAPVSTKMFVITLLLLVVSGVIAAYGLTGDVLGVFVNKGSFLLSISFLYSLLIISSLLATFFVTYFFAETPGILGTFKAISGFYPAVITLNLASLLLGLFGAAKLAILCFGAALLLAGILIGAFVTGDAVRHTSKTINGFYAYVLYFFISIAMLFYISSTIAHSILDNFIQNILF
jgi:hypothetical protein